MKIELAQTALSSNEKIALVTNLVAAYYENGKEVGGKIKSEVAQTRDEIFKAIAEPGFDHASMTALISSGISDPDIQRDLASYVQTFIERVDKLQEQQKLFIAKDGKNTVGMCGYKDVGINPSNGKTVFEMSHLSVLPQAQGNNLGRQMQLYIFEHILENHGDCDLLFASVNPGIQRITEAMGGERIDPLLTKTFADGVPVAERSVQEREWADNENRIGKKYYLMHLDSSTLAKLTSSV